VTEASPGAVVAVGQSGPAAEPAEAEPEPEPAPDGHQPLVEPEPGRA